MDNLFIDVPEYVKIWIEGKGPEYFSSLLQTTYESEHNKSSVSIGKSGEAEVERIISEYYTIIKSSKTIHNGDFIIKTKRGVVILIEVKTWTSVVNNSEKTKFLNDINSNGTVSAAVMISRSKIVGSKAIEYIEHNNGSSIVPVIYASCYNECIIQIIDTLEIDVLNRKRHISMDTDIHTIVQNVSNQIDFITSAERSLFDMNKDFNKHYSKLLKSLTTASINLKQSVQSLQSYITEDTKGSQDVKLSDITMLSKKNLILLTHILSDKKYTIHLTDRQLVINIDNIIIKANKTSVKFNIPTKSPYDLISKFKEFTYNGDILTVTLTDDNSCILGQVINNLFSIPE